MPRRLRATWHAIIKPMILGIDEAGRGAVIGPLVITGVVFKDNSEIFEVLYSYDIKDSKLLTAQRRKELARLIKKLKHSHLTFKITPKILDRESLNKLEIRYSSRIIDKLKPKDVYLDVPASGKGIENYCNNVKKGCSHRAKIFGANKLDSTNIVVAAASILAKEAREKGIRDLYGLYGNFGSGYPSDPRTREWLRVWQRKNKDWPEIVRKKWKTLNKII